MLDIAKLYADNTETDSVEKRLFNTCGVTVENPALHRVQCMKMIQSTEKLIKMPQY